MHKALQRFAERHGGEISDEAPGLIHALLVEALEEAGMPPSAMARERALASQAAHWLAAFERRRRPGAQLLVERKGVLPVHSGGFALTLTARADRLELRDGQIDILDFKTGQAPSKRQMESGFSPQLTLTAAIVEGGGFDGVAGVAPGELVYVRVTGGRKPGEELIRAAAGETQVLGQTALEGLRRRIGRFASPDTPYLSWAAPQYMQARGGDYDHLARVWEWHVIGEGEDAGE